HSWSFNGSYVSPALELRAENALNTFSIVGDASYNVNEERMGGGLTLRYGGLYPVLSLGARFQDRSILNEDTNFPDSLVIRRTSFNQMAITAGATVPLNWISGNFIHNFRARLSYSALRLGQISTPESRLPDQLGSAGLLLSYQSLHRIARRQVQPRFGLAATLFYDRGMGRDITANRFLLRSNFYLPGLLQTHGVRLDFNFQQEPLTNAYQYPDGMRYVRGYNTPFSDRATTLGINYQFPLLYPDIGALGIVYLQRIRVNAFYDTGNFYLNSIDASFPMRSSGAEFFFDTSWLNAQEISFGVQAAYLLERDLFNGPNASRLQWQLLFTGSF
ncbi:MAG: hypothetical protein AAF828_08935, partial [Bacteroidota bacterium]